MAGKCVELPDAHNSVNEALKHAGIKIARKSRFSTLTRKILKEVYSFDDVDAILIPCGFGERGVEGKIKGDSMSENKVPYRVFV